MQNRRLPSWFPLVLRLLLIVTVSFIVNFVMLSRHVAPPGADYGNYLTQVDILNGNDLRGLGLRHNPVFFVFLDFLLRFLDEFTALKVAASFVFSIIAVPFFLFAKKLSGNNLAAMISAGLFVFFLAYFEMIAWGGNPNFLGFSFMLLALLFIVDLMKEPSRRNFLLSGFFLSLVIGTHVLVTIFSFLSLLVFVALTWMFRGMSKDKFKNLFFMVLVALVFSLPYLPFYLGFLRNSTGEEFGFNLLLIEISRISLSGIWWFVPQFFFMAIIAVLGIFALSKYLKENRSNGLLLCSLFLAFLLLVLTTAQPIRWLYFLPIPSLLCFCLYLKYLFSDAKNSRRTILLFASIFIVMIILQSTFLAINHFELATEFYSFIGDDEIQALDWIRENTASNATFATSGHPKNVGGCGNSYAWWIEGYSKRKCVFSGDPKLFSYKFERDEIGIANLIFAGTYSVEYNGLRVTEAFPAGTSNPEIAGFVEGQYENMLILSDDQHQLFFSPTENEQAMYVAPFYAENKTPIIYYKDAWANITITYEQPQFELTRSVIIGEEKSSVDVIFQVSPKTATLRLFKINFWALFNTSLTNCEVGEDSVVTLSQPPSDENAKIQISVLQTNGKLEGARVLFEDPENSKPVVNYMFEPLQDDLLVHIRVSLDSSTLGAKTQAIQFYDSYSLIKDLKVDYILLNKHRVNEYQRFLYDREHFTVIFQNEGITIFEVV